MRQKNRRKKTARALHKFKRFVESTPSLTQPAQPTNPAYPEGLMNKIEKGVVIRRNIS
jgi:hypothetical protein